MKATPEVVLLREQARFWWAATNFLRWIRREFSKPVVVQIEIDERVQARILPKVRTIGGMASFMASNTRKDATSR